MLRWCSRSIFLQVVIGLMLGIACGLALPEFSSQLKPLGDGFIKLIKMLIGLIVFCVVVSGISGAGDLKKVGRIGLKSVIYFEVLTTVALVLGLIMALLAYIPFMGLLAPSLAALAYLHFCLESLRRLRGDAVLSVSQNAR